MAIKIDVQGYECRVSLNISFTSLEIMKYIKILIWMLPYTQTIIPLPEKTSAQIFIIYFSKFLTTSVVLFRDQPMHIKGEQY